MARIVCPSSPTEPSPSSRTSAMPRNSTQTGDGADEFAKPELSDTSDKLPADKGMDIIELDKAGIVQRKWVHLPNSRPMQVELASTTGTLWRPLRAWRDPLFDAFLPVGFPHSVSPDYLAYQTYDSLQAFFSTITSMLANRAILEGLGVGDSSTSATYALLLTVLKDAMSRLATIAFAQRFGLAIEPECKSYRFLADLFNDSAFFLDLVSPVVEGVPKVVVLSTAEALRALCGVAAGASKAALSSHFAKQDNLAELNAKEASQETAIGLIGLLVGTVVVKLVEDRTTVFYLMISLVFVHLLMNYLGVRAVTLQTLNRQRATILYQQWLQTGRVASPAEVASKEAMVFWWPVLKNRRGAFTGIAYFAKSYAAAVEGVSDADILQYPRFWLAVQRHRQVDIRILMKEGAEPFDAVEAWIEAMELARKGGSFQGSITNVSSLKRERPQEPQYQTWASQMRVRIEEAGWDLSNASFETTAPVRIRVATQETQEKKEQ